MSSNSVYSKTSKTSKSSWNSNNNAYQQEIEDLKRTLNDYENANKDLKEEVYRLLEVEELHKKRLQDSDKLQKQLQKKLKSFEVSLKYEKAASEGLRKRGNNFEASVLEFKEKSDYSDQKFKYYYDQNQELENTLQHERSTRLQLLHEKNQLFHELKELQRKFSQLERENVDKNIKITNYIQQIETLTEKTKKQDDLLNVQAEEFLEVTREIISVKQNLLKTKEMLLQETTEKSNFHFSVDLLQKEISFLRKELILSSENTTNKSFSAFHPQRKDHYQITNEVNKVTSKRYKESNFRTDRTFTRKHDENDSSKNGDDLNQHSFITPLNQQPSSALNDFPSLFSASDSRLLTAGSAHSRRGNDTAVSYTSETEDGDGSTTQSLHEGGRNIVSRLSTADRPRGALDYLTTTNKDSGNFNNKERVQMLEWIRLSGNEIAAQNIQHRSQPSPEKLVLRQSVENMRKAYGGSSAESTAPSNSSAKSKEEDPRYEFGSDEDEEDTDGEKRQAKAKDYSRRSLYVGSGLNYKHNEALDNQLKELQSGSTKQILKRILHTID